MNDKQEGIVKCHECKQEIDLFTEDLSNLIRYDNKNYHNGCFCKMCERKSKKKNTTQKKWLGCLKHIKDIQDESNKYYINIFYRKKLEKFLKEEYDLVLIPSNFFVRLSQINNGSYKNIGVCISNKDIYDMWQMKIKKFNEIAHWKKSQGQHIDSTERLIYDLAILVNKYNSFVEWKNKQKILEMAEKTKEKEHHADEILTNVIVKSSYKEGGDISNLVDEIFS